MLKMVYKGKFTLWAAIGLKWKKHHLWWTQPKHKSSGSLPSQPCTIFMQHSCWRCIFPGTLWPHLWVARVPGYSAACSDSSSLWTMYFEQSNSNVRIPHCSCQIYTWSQHCRPHVCRLQSEASAVAPHGTYDKAWSCKQPFSHLTMLTLTTWNSITKGQDT